MPQITYQGIARGSGQERRTKHYPTLYQAYEAAERLARKHMGECGEVAVAVYEGEKVLAEYYHAPARSLSGQTKQRR